MADNELGVVFDTVRDVVGGTNQVIDTMSTVENVCDGVVVALGAVSVIPGAAAFTGPVISVYEAIRPILDTVIKIGGIVVEVLNYIIQAMDALDDLLKGDFDAFIQDASGIANAAYGDTR